jgi:L-asparaginase
MSIRIIITGGTFDKKYNAIEGILTFEESHLPFILDQARVSVPVECEVNQLIDSLQMTDADRLRILEACRTAVEDQIIVTHGTDTMVDTARILGEAKLVKTIILTGAMIPFSVSGSDSLFNLGCSFTAAQLLPAGVYVSMNGQIFPWDDVRKDRERGYFRPINLDQPE